MELDERDALINLKEFLETRQCLITEDYFLREKNVMEFIKNDIDLPEPSFLKLSEMCNFELLNSSENQIALKEVDDLNSEDLSSIEYIKKCYSDTTKKTQAQDFKFMKNLARLNELEPEQNDVIKTPDIVLSVQISQGLNNNKTRNKLAWSEDFLVLGQNYLSSLKDKISCFRKEIRVGEFSENLDKLKEAPLMKDLIKSGFFFIENTIYNDLRNDNNDCSIEIIKWAKEKNIGEFKSECMESTKFIDLSVKLGFPYLFTHLGNCEHLLLFTNLKMVNPSSDCYCLSKYPILKDKSRGRFNFCWLCNKIYAKWVVCNSQYSVDDPTFLCERCIRNTHYGNIEMNKLINTENLLTGETNNSQSKNESQTEEEQENEEKKLFNFQAYHFSQL